MRVRQIMTKSVLTCRASDSLARAAQIMWENDIGCLPVLHEGRLAGMITDRDIAMVAYLKRDRLLDIHVSAAMTHQVLCCHPDDDVADVERTMSQCQVRRVPVIDELECPIGMLSLNDIALASTRGGEVTPAEVATLLAAVSAPRQTLPRV
jgi:CBS domain-containing protein